MPEEEGTSALKNIYQFTTPHPNEENGPQGTAKGSGPDNPPDTRERLVSDRLCEEIEELTRANEALRLEINKLRKAEEALRETEENFRVLMDYADEAAGLIHQMREEIEESNLKASRGKVLVKAFIHDLKGPLALISSCAQFCLESMVQVPPLEENLKIIHESTQRANHLIRKFLELFEWQVLVFKPLDINEIISRAWETAQQDIQAPQVLFDARLQPDLPKVLGSPDGLERVFVNLFVNALQALSKKGMVGAQSQFLPSENMVEVRVMDNGPGIPPGDRYRIFQPFFTTKEEGSGLGLSICRSIIQQHKGMIEADNLPEGGARFTIKLPIV